MTGSQSTIDVFLDDLAKCGNELYGISENLYREDSPEGKLRRYNLKLYLHQIINLEPKVLLLGEAPGYKGCKLTGVPFSSEKIISEHPFFVSSKYKLLDSTGSLESEISATIVWNELSKFKKMPLIWNIFPFHPHQKNNPKSNRTPNPSELNLGKNILTKLLDLFTIKTIAAVGRKPEHALKELEIDCIYVRHPSHGGKNQFIKGLKNVLK